MGETANKARMAEILSNELFGVFKWRKVGPMNHNWKCVITSHRKGTHPSDVVFRYVDPYEDKAIYLNCDLKSYSRKSITKTSIADAIASLAMSTECMQFSDEWQDAYQQPSEACEKRSLLFVYNHDGEYDTSFKGVVNTIDSSYFSLRKGCKMYLMGPSDITYLKTVANDIETLRGRKAIPDDEFCTFYYPDLIRKKIGDDRQLAASVEMLLGPWQILQYSSDSKNGILIYYKGSGDTFEEFLYLIDYLAHYQMLRSEWSINLRLPNAARTAVGNFEKSVKEYARLQQLPSLEARLSRIKVESVTNIVTRFSEIEIGMED